MAFHDQWQDPAIRWGLIVIAVLAVIAVVLLATGCGDDTGDDYGPRPVPISDPAEGGWDHLYLIYLNLGNRRILECVARNLGYANGVVDCNWGS